LQIKITAIFLNKNILYLHQNKKNNFIEKNYKPREKLLGGKRDQEVCMRIMSIMTNYNQMLPQLNKQTANLTEHFFSANKLLENIKWKLEL
jgi:hypothetical protein